MQVSEPNLAEEGIPALVGRLVDDGRNVVEAEIAVQKARLSVKTQAYKGAAIFFAAAGVLALAALIALLVGLILTLATLVGPGGATAIVIGATLAIAAVLALMGRSRLNAPSHPKPEAS